MIMLLCHLLITMQNYSQQFIKYVWVGYIKLQNSLTFNPLKYTETQPATHLVPNQSLRITSPLCPFAPLHAYYLYQQVMQL